VLLFGTPWDRLSGSDTKWRLAAVGLPSGVPPAAQAEVHKAVKTGTVWSCLIPFSCRLLLCSTCID